MKETRSLSLSLHEWITSWVHIESINNQARKFFAALFMIPIMLFFLILDLFIEEPLKCIFSLITFRTTPRKILIYYKRCWKSLFAGIKQS